MTGEFEMYSPWKSDWTHNPSQLFCKIFLSLEFCLWKSVWGWTHFAMIDKKKVHPGLSHAVPIDTENLSGKHQHWKDAGLELHAGGWLGWRPNTSNMLVDKMQIGSRRDSCCKRHAEQPLWLKDSWQASSHNCWKSWSCPPSNRKWIKDAAWCPPCSLQSRSHKLNALWTVLACASWLQVVWEMPIRSETKSTCIPNTVQPTLSVKRTTKSKSWKL